MEDKRKAIRERVQRWRKELAARGGREVTMALEAPALARLERLKAHYELPAGEIVSFALVILEKQKRAFPIGSKKSGGKGEGK